MTAERAEPLHKARRLDSDRKRTLVLAATDAVLGTGRQPTIAAIARTAGVGRKFIYDHPDLKADIELKAAETTRHQANGLVSTARVTGASLRAELENARAQNRRLTRQLQAAEHRLSKAEGVRLIADELLPDRLLTELADQQLAKRATELDRLLFEAREDLRRTTEELEAARSINRELMQQANRPLPHDRGDHSRRPPRPSTAEEP